MPRLILISDTHSLHRRVELPEGDIIIHAGDWQNSGRDWDDVYNFSTWWNDLQFKHKILIDGNHDGLAQAARSIVVDAFKDTHYLLDSDVEIEDIKFYGSPYSPTFFNWWFMKDRGDPIKKHWDLIPSDTDVLITHTPPMGMLDTLEDGNHVGCEELAKTVDKVNPKVHVFGHIHNGYGQQQIGDTLFVNASQVNEAYKVVNKPIVIDL
jgi:Icc-related predicted phosphoesterase